MDAGVIASIITSAVAITVAVVTLILQGRQNTAIEHTKAQLQQLDFIHRLQFEKEFEIYLELWKLLTNYSSEVAKFTMKVQRTKELSELANDVIKLTKTIKEFRDFTENHKPFFSEEVYSELNKSGALIGSAINFGVEFHSGMKSEELTKRTAQISIDIMVLYDGVCTAIRKRITVKIKQ